MEHLGILKPNAPLLWRTIVNTYESDDEQKLKADAEQIHRILGEVDGPFVELGCGRGRLLSHLSELHPHCIGVDITPQFINDAVAMGSKADFHCVDARAFLKGQPDSSIACIAAFGTSIFGYGSSIREDFDLLIQANRVLRKGIGLLLIEACHPRCMPKRTNCSDGIVREIDLHGSSAEFRYSKNGAPLVTTRLSVFTPQLLNTLGAKAGFDPILVYQDLHQRPMTDDSSRFLLMMRSDTQSRGPQQ